MPLFFQTFSYLRLIGSIPGVDRRGIIEPLILHIKAGRKATRIARVVVADRAVGEHSHEGSGVARTRGTEPPTASTATVALFHAAPLALENLELRAIGLVVPPFINAENVVAGGEPQSIGVLVELAVDFLDHAARLDYVAELFRDCL